jgi:hypothetical protein
MEDRVREVYSMFGSVACMKMTEIQDGLVARDLPKTGNKWEITDRLDRALQIETMAGVMPLSKDENRSIEKEQPQITYDCTKKRKHPETASYDDDDDEEVIGMVKRMLPSEFEPSKRHRGELVVDDKEAKLEEITLPLRRKTSIEVDNCRNKKMLMCKIFLEGYTNTWRRATVSCSAYCETLVRTLTNSFDIEPDLPFYANYHGTTQRAFKSGSLDTLPGRHACLTQVSELNLEAGDGLDIIYDKPSKYRLYMLVEGERLGNPCVFGGVQVLSGKGKLADDVDDVKSRW